MGFLKSLGKGLKKIGKGVLKYGAPVAGFALGGPAGAALGGALGNTIGSGRPTLKKIGTGALSGALTGGTGAGLLKGGLGAVGKQGFAGAALGGLKKIGSAAIANPELALGALSAYEQMQAGRQADKAAQAALDFERQRYGEQAPMRQLGMQGMLASPPRFQPLQIPRRQDMAFDTGFSSNPFARRAY